MYTYLCATAADQHRQQLLTEAAEARAATRARRERPRVRKQRRFPRWSLEPLFDASSVVPAGARPA
jgi:hypothetical protein